MSKPLLARDGGPGPGPAPRPRVRFETGSRRRRRWSACGEVAEKLTVGIPAGPITRSAIASALALELGPTIACTPSTSTRRRASCDRLLGVGEVVSPIADRHALPEYTAGGVDVLDRQFEGAPPVGDHLFGRAAAEVHQQTDLQCPRTLPTPPPPPPPNRSDSATGQAGSPPHTTYPPRTPTGPLPSSSYHYPQKDRSTATDWRSTPTIEQAVQHRVEAGRRRVVAN